MHNKSSNKNNYRMKTHTQMLLRGSALSLLLLGAPLTARAAQINNAAPTLTQPVVAGNPLAWTEWELVAPAYAGLEKAPFLKFSDARLSASVGLNSIGGAYTLDGQNIRVQPLASTRMAGPPALMNAEDLYGKALSNARGFQLSRDGQRLTLRGDTTLTFRLTGRTSQGFVATETKIINVAPELGPQLDGDQTPKFLQLEDLSEGVSWGRFSEEKIEGFRFVPGYRYQLRVVVERDARSGDKRLRALEVFSQQWMRTAKIEGNHKIVEVAPTRVAGSLQVREAGSQWKPLRTPIAGFDFQQGWRYRLQVAVKNTDNSSNPRYTLVRLLDKMPVTF